MCVQWTQPKSGIGLNKFNLSDLKRGGRRRLCWALPPRPTAVTATKASDPRTMKNLRTS